LGGLNDLRNGQFIVTAGKVLLPRTGKSMPAKLLEVADHAFKEALQKLNDKLFQDNRKYLFGDHLTICDFLFAEMVMNA
jgi:glutathione S-transferase